MGADAPRAQNRQRGDQCPCPAALCPRPTTTIPPPHLQASVKERLVRRRMRRMAQAQEAFHNRRIVRARSCVRAARGWGPRGGVGGWRHAGLEWGRGAGATAGALMGGDSGGVGLMPLTAAACAKAGSGIRRRARCRRRRRRQHVHVCRWPAVSVSHVPYTLRYHQHSHRRYLDTSFPTPTAAHLCPRHSSAGHWPPFHSCRSW